MKISIRIRISHIRKEIFEYSNIFEYSSYTETASQEDNLTGRQKEEYTDEDNHRGEITSEKQKVKEEGLK